MSLPLYIQGRSDVGRQREQNEDNFRVLERPDGSWVLVVCDGMGGHEAGEVASDVASRRIAEVLGSSSTAQPPRALYDALMEANRAVVDAALTRGTPGMGTTAVAAWVLGGRCYVGWVGDSRLYHFRRGTLIERSRDHTRVEQMVQHGILTPEQAKQHPEAHVLVRALGGSVGVQQGFKPEVWNEPLELQAGDVVLLCSDGLYDLVEDGELYPLMEKRDCLSAVDTLIRTANERGGVDNITAVVLVAGQPEVPASGPVPQSGARRDTLRDAPARRETLPETPLVVPGVEQVAGAPVVDPGPVPMGASAARAEAVQAEEDTRARGAHPVAMMEPPPEPEGDAPDPVAEEAAVPARGSRRVPVLWALVGAAGTLLAGGLLGWAFGRGSSEPVPAPPPVMAASNAPAPPSVTAPERAAVPAVLPPSEDVGIAAAAPDAGSGDAGAAPSMAALAAPAPVPSSEDAGTPDGGTTAASDAGVALPAPAPAPKKKGTAAPPAPASPKPSSRGSTSGGKGT